MVKQNTTKAALLLMVVGLCLGACKVVDDNGAEKSLVDLREEIHGPYYDQPLYWYVLDILESYEYFLELGIWCINNENIDVFRSFEREMIKASDKDWEQDSEFISYIRQSVFSTTTSGEIRVGDSMFWASSCLNGTSSHSMSNKINLIDYNHFTQGWYQGGPMTHITKQGRELINEIRAKRADALNRI